MFMTMIITDRKTGEIYFADSFYEAQDAIERITGDEVLAEDVAYWFEDGDFDREPPADDRFEIQLEPEERYSMNSLFYEVG